MRSDAVRPLISFAARRVTLGATAEVRALAEHAGAFEDGLALLVELDQRWGPGGELATLAHRRRGRPLEVCWETLLLLTLSDAAGVELDLGRHTATRIATLTLPSVAAQRQLAARMTTQELRAAGCVAAEVVIG